MSSVPAYADQPLLEVRGLRAGFGSQMIIHGVDLDVRAGEVTGLFGLNGAGKSMLLKVIAGVVPAWAGTIRLNGLEISKLQAEQRVAHGMAHVPQGRQVFPTLSVEQNLRVGAYTLRRRDRSAYAGRLEMVYDIFPRLADRRSQPAGTMSGGEQAMLAVGRALICDPKLVLIDEPSAGLAPAVVEDLLEILLRVRGLGLTMLLVEQNIRFGLRLSDNACLLQKGRVVYSGSRDDLDQDRLAQYLGVGRLLTSDLSAGLAKPGKSRSRRNQAARLT
jgi:branched-chain amino acid transport system ATP-binding protein